MKTGRQKSEFLDDGTSAPAPTNRPLGRLSAAAIRVPLGNVTREGVVECKPEAFVDAEEAGNFLQLQRRRVLQLARQGQLPAYPLGDGMRRVWRFRLSELASAMLHFRQRSHVPEEI